jgi:hypothetical protein
MPVVPDLTHRSPVGQSRDWVQALWHLANAQMSGELQSVLIEHVLARPTAEELLQLEAAAATSPPSNNPATRTIPLRRFAKESSQAAKLASSRSASKLSIVETCLKRVHLPGEALNHGEP